jgi:phosphatidylglycerophosphate synthase
MRPADLWRFFFGPGERWEYRLVAARIAVVVAAILVVYALLHSSWKQYAALLVWPLFALFVASVIYQWVRRWRHLRQKQESGPSTSNHDA